MLGLAGVSFWIVRAQGLVYGYFNFLNIARYPDVIFPRIFRMIFGWVIPVVIIANIPARLLIKSLGQPTQLMLHLVIASMHCFLAGARLLEICSAALLERQLVNGHVDASVSQRRPTIALKPTASKRRANFLTESACAAREMFLIKRPFFPACSSRTPFTLWLNQRKRRVPLKSPLRAKRDRRERFPPKSRSKRRPCRPRRRRRSGL